MFSPTVDGPEISYICDLASGIVGVSNEQLCFLTSGLIHPQFYAMWLSGVACVVLNTERSKPNTIVTCATDVSLLIVMIAGLLPLRRENGSRLGMGNLLFKQVGGGAFP
jgi:hypothetical protein